ncbi:MAG: glycosyltransferase family 39 protein, partial [Candidatus Promineifilaceae bacterium]|nr:glycosyltransferase family 39 protein [Candidatus Promineifilaceae bacterium]
DEGVVMVRAANILEGDDTELCVHEKGPVEILVPIAVWGTTGAVTDFWARLPFTWAGWLGVAGVWLVARHWFGRREATVAAGLFAISGFGIAFSRIVQYQAFVVFWTSLALVAATRFSRQRDGKSLWLAVLFSAAGLLAHYDAILTLPAVGWLLLVGARRVTAPDWRRWLLALATGLTLLALFYVPFAASPSFQRTFGYLLDDRLGAGAGRSLLSWSVPQVWQMLTFYNSSWYVVGILSLTAVGIAQLLRTRAGMPALLYFVIPAVFYSFIVADPRTHVYTLIPGAVVLAGLGAWLIMKRIEPTGRATGVTVAATILGAVWLVVSLSYVLLLFVDWSPERQRAWEENRPPSWLSPTTWTDPPQYGLFGFPHQAGWRLVSRFVGEEGLPYASNEEREITDWYMAQAKRTHCANFRSFILGENVQDAMPYDPEWLQEAYLHYEFTVDGRPGLRIYRREPAWVVETVEALGVSRWVTPEELVRSRHGGENELDLMLGDRIRLLGYDLDTEKAVPGGRLVVTLYWQSSAPIERNHQVFVHLYDGEMWAQHDSAPECGLNPTTHWEPGEIVVDPHIVELPADTPLIQIPVWVGMYELLSEDRLAVEGYPDDRIPLGKVQIKGR